MPTPKVVLVLKGLLAIFVNPDETECTVGMLGSPPPHHDQRITIKTSPIEGEATEMVIVPPQIKRNLRLEAENVSQTKITFYERNATINRQAEPAPADKYPFRWAVDLEHAELYGRVIGVKIGGFNPILKFKKGEFFTKRISRNHLFTQIGIYTFEDFGFVANEIGVELRLDGADSKAVFYNGGDAFPLAAPNTNYEIEIFQDITEEHEHPGIVTDANHYYKTVGLGLSETERILFMSRAEGGPPAGPEAACFSAFFGKSQPE